MFVLFNHGCNKSPRTSTAEVLIESDPATKEKVEEFLKSNPVFVDPRTETEYTIKIIDPNILSKDVKQEILMLQPDANDYSIIVIDPQTGKQNPILSDEIKDAIEKALKDQ